MAELGFNSAEVQAEVEKINNLAKTVQDDADRLVEIAKKISDQGIRGVDWYDWTFSSMLSKLQNNKVSDAIEEIKFQGQKLVGIGETSSTFSVTQE